MPHDIPTPEERQEAQRRQILRQYLRRLRPPERPNQSDPDSINYKHIEYRIRHGLPIQRN